MGLVMGAIVGLVVSLWQNVADVDKSAATCYDGDGGEKMKLNSLAGRTIKEAYRALIDASHSYVPYTLPRGIEPFYAAGATTDGVEWAAWLNVKGEPIALGAQNEEGEVLKCHPDGGCKYADLTRRLMPAFYGEQFLEESLFKEVEQ